ncbi:Sec-independent protein translocase subunit TatA/TatB [Mesorhizobium comanense]|uniref:Sec-independent protein translocase subunit TatA/TatB n=1 Tax=Mesorhizobium comanense TaxID=2502215 RepID=UPI001484D3F5|nr:twin-arginine translocase TatA/TatE family subunit [Mesorhizobium comanense]
MFGLGWDHLVVIFVVAMVVFGPGELPNVMRSLGATMKTVNRYVGDFRRQFDDAMREAEKELDLEDTRAKLRNAGSSVTQDAGTTEVAKERGQDARTAAS